MNTPKPEGQSTEDIEAAGTRFVPTGAPPRIASLQAEIVLLKQVISRLEDRIRIIEKGS